ncbi:MAG: phosphatidylglycerol lysyltransferase domain-containing protein [Deltaproteobacteria bacterium]|nr:phosphatidylglycerol lysyltransferase domain-containing protein [Deltaproteobacteria bacterium]
MLEADGGDQLQEVMTFKPLELADRPVFREIEKSRPLPTSDANFSNMFMWRSYYRFSWTEAHGCLCLLARPEGRPAFGFPPLGDGDKVRAVEFLFENMDEPLLTRTPEAMAVELAAARPGWRLAPDPDNDDYVYLVDKIVTLSGRRMHQKKNHYNYFVQNYRYEAIEVTPALHDELVEVEAKWLTSKTEKIGPDSHLRMEQEAVHVLLENFEALETCGLAIRIDGRIEAFALGERLSGDTGLVHVEKGNPDVRGIYVALCSFFCRSCFGDLTYVNREQDLGLPGLRRSKESLKPDHMEKKFNVRP